MAAARKTRKPVKRKVVSKKRSPRPKPARKSAPKRPAAKAKGARKTVKAPRKASTPKAARKSAAPARSVVKAPAKATAVKAATKPLKVKIAGMREVKDALLKRRTFLLKNLGRLTSTVSEVSDKPVGDRADDASIDLEVDSSYKIAEHEAEELRMIDTALEKIAAGTYGVCEECKNAIERPRLKALPYAVLCLKCKQAEELSRVERSEVDYSEMEEE